MCAGRLGLASGLTGGHIAVRDKLHMSDQCKYRHRDPPPPHQVAAPRSERRCRRWTAASRCARPEDSERRRSARAAAQTEEASQVGSESTASRIKQEHLY